MRRTLVKQTKRGVAEVSLMDRDDLLLGVCFRGPGFCARCGLDWTLEEGQQRRQDLPARQAQSEVET